MHNGWDELGSDDIALLNLTEPLTSVAPAQLYTGSNENRQPMNIVGYGQSGTGYTGAVTSAGTKRAGENVFSLGSVLNDILGYVAYDDDLIVADFDEPTSGASDLAVSLDMEFLAAPGDSGGAVFFESGGQTYLAGVISFLLAITDDYADASYTDVMAATRVSQYIDWINTHAVITMPPPPIPGDFNSDGAVDAADLALLLDNWGQTHRPVNWTTEWDGFVDSTELVDLLDHWREGASAPSVITMEVPEPISMTAWLIGGALGITRRRYRPKR